MLRGSLTHLLGWVPKLLSFHSAAPVCLLPTNESNKPGFLSLSECCCTFPLCLIPALVLYVGTTAWSETSCVFVGHVPLCLHMEIYRVNPLVCFPVGARIMGCSLL